MPRRVAWVPIRCRTFTGSINTHLNTKLSAVLRSDRAVQMSIAIVRTFVRMRELMATNKEIAARVEKLERGHDRTASAIEVLVEDIDRIAREVKDMKALTQVTKRRIGFVLDEG